MAARLQKVTRKEFGRYDRPDFVRVPALRRNGGVVALAAVNGPGAYEKKFSGETMAKKRKTKSKSKRPAARRKATRAKLVKHRSGAGGRLFLKAAPKKRTKRRAGTKRRVYAGFTRNAAKAAPAKKRDNALATERAKNKALETKLNEIQKAHDSLAAAEASRSASRIAAAEKRVAKAEAAYKAKAKSTPQFKTVKRTKKVKERVAYGPSVRYRHPKLGLTYGTMVKGKVRKIPAWQIGGAPSAKAFAGEKYAKKRENIGKLRDAISKKLAKKFKAQLDRQLAGVKKVADKQERELKKIKEGKSIMAPNRRRRRSMKRNKAKAKARPKARAKRYNRTRYSLKRSVTRRKKRGKGKLTRGAIRIQHVFARGKRRVTRKYSMKYKARKGTRGSIFLIPPGAGRSRKRQRKYSFTANKRRSIRRRKGFRRNGAFSPLMTAVKVGLPAVGGFAGHKLITNALTSVMGMVPVPEALTGAIAGLLALAAGSFAANAVIKGPAGSAVLTGMGVSFLHQIITLGLKAAGLDGAAGYLAGYGGIATRRTTSYGSYEQLSGLGQPFLQAAAGYGSLPYAQALAGNTFAGRGNYLDVPSLGAFPEQAAAGYGDYEQTSQGGTFNGIGTDNTSVERALDIADRQGSVGGFGGFGDAGVLNESILMPDGAVSPVGGSRELPLTSGVFAANNLGTAY